MTSGVASAEHLLVAGGMTGVVAAPLGDDFISYPSRMASGVHHLYVETRDWDQSVAFWEALGFHLEEGWGAQHDGILSPADGSPYVFLREAQDDQASLAFQVVFGSANLDLVARAEGVTVDSPRYASGWGPDLLDVRDPDGRLLTIREDATRGRER